MPPTDEPGLEADRFLRMARTTAHLGRFEQAVRNYDEALALRPGFGEAFFEVVDLLTAAEDWSSIARHCDTWIEHFPDHASHGFTDRVHNLRIGALCHLGGIELAYDAYGLEQITSGTIHLADDEIIAVVVARNERSRLEFLLEHHRRIGVDRFLFIDNGSDDGSVDYLLGEPDTIVWRARGSFLRANAGTAWTDLVLRRYAPPQWCLVIDADELFIFPGFERRGLRALCTDLDREGATCYRALEIDMYGKGRLSEATLRSGEDPLEVFPYFDRVHYRVRTPYHGPRRNMTNYCGGVRSRIFGGDLRGYLLNKVPLFRYSPGEVVMSGQHWLSRPTGEIGTGRGGLLHFKYTAAFAKAVTEELARKEHPGQATIYKQYARGLEGNSDPVLFDPVHSVRYESSDQLVALGVMNEGLAAVPVAVTHDTVLIPPIPAVPRGGLPDQPFWSVVMILHDESSARARVERVVRALDGAPPSEVVVVVRCQTREHAAALLDPAANGSHAIVVASTPQHLSDVESANLALGRTRGSWVHVLGPDNPAPAFYDAMAAAITAPGVALAVAHPLPLDEAIGLDFAVRSSCFVAARDLYERAGGFCATMPFAAAWEMFQRLAHTAEIAPVSVRVPLHPATDCDAGPPPGFAGYGEEVLHWMAAVDLVRDLAELNPSDVLALHDRCAIRAADLARQDIEHGRFESALATVAQALRAPASADARWHLTTVLARTSR